MKKELTIEEIIGSGAEALAYYCTEATLLKAGDHFASARSQEEQYAFDTVLRACNIADSLREVQEYGVARFAHAPSHLTDRDIVLLGVQALAEHCSRVALAKEVNYRKQALHYAQQFLSGLPLEMAQAAFTILRAAFATQPDHESQAA